MLNVIGTVPVPSVPGRPSFIRTTFAWSELPKIVTEPGELPARVFGWGSANFDVDRLIEYLAEFFVGLGLPIRLARPERALTAGYLGLPPGATPPVVPSLVVPIFRIQSGGASIEAAVVLHALPATGGALPGLVLELHIPTAFPRTLRLTDWVTPRTPAASEPAAPFGIRIRPGNVSVIAPLSPATTAPPIGFGFDFSPRTPTVLLGDPNASRLEFAGASVDLATSFNNGQWSANIGADLKGFKFIFDPGEGDGFLRFLIGSAKTEIGIPLGLQWTGSGIRFGGSASFNVVVHPHISIGPATVEEIDFRLGIPLGGKPRVMLQVGAAIAADMGPVSMMLKGVGLQADVLFEPGNAGRSISMSGSSRRTASASRSMAAASTAAASSSSMPERGEYAGTLELSSRSHHRSRPSASSTTRLPDGQPRLLAAASSSPRSSRRSSSASASR